jgi:hypothetical protein
MHARTDFAHAAAVMRILAAHGIVPREDFTGEDVRRAGYVPGGQATAAVQAAHSTRARGPRVGGC